MGKEFHRRYAWASSAFQKREGEQNKMAKMKSAEVLAIREEYDAGQRGLTNAWRYGITPSHYNTIGRRLRWRHL